MFGIIIAATGGRGIFIYDRGGDNIEFYRYFLEKNVDFIVRLKSRYVFSWKRKVTCEELAKQCPTRYSDVITFDSHGKEVRITLHYGVVPVRLPDLKGKLLHMVVVRGFGQKPMMLLTTLAKTTTRTDLWQVVSAYITRWRVEETIRIHELPDFHFYAIADGINFYTLTDYDFNFVIVKGNKRTVYKNCIISDISEDGTLKDKVAEKITLMALDRVEE